MANFGLSISDFVSLTALAYNVYTGCRDAPKNFADISTEVINLHRALKQVDDLLGSSNLAPDKARDLEQIAGNCRAVLVEIQKKLDHFASLGTTSKKLWDRLRLGESDVQRFRVQLTSVTGTLTAFNATLTNSTQFVILNKLAQILAEIQSGKRRDGSIISTRARTIGGASTKEVVEEAVEGVTRELEAEGIPKAALTANKPTIDEFIKNAIESGAWNELVDVDDSESSLQTTPMPPILTPQNSSPRLSEVQLHKSQSTDHSEPPEQNIPLPPANTGARTIEILSATYGPLDATDKMRNFFRVPLPGRRTNRSFVPNNTFFGGDPLLNSFKVFVMVWRVIHTSPDQFAPRISTIQTTRSFEGLPLTIDIGGPFLEEPPSPPPDPDADDANTLHIVSASYHNYNVTAHLRRLLSQWSPPVRLTLPVSNEQFGHDPGYGWVKVLSVTYAYTLPSSSSPFPDSSSSYPHYSRNLMYTVKTCLEGRTLMIPPLLTINIANWGGLDVSDTLRAQVSADQTLRIDMNSLIAPDPWVRVQKTLSMIYTYAGEAMQILVTREGVGTMAVVPDGPPRRSQFGVPKPKGEPGEPPDDREQIGTPFEDKALEGWRLLAVIWGHHAVGKEVFWAIAEKPVFECSNEFFGFDGNVGWAKTCQVLVRDPGGVLECVVAREGEEMRVGDSLR